jgi:para-aminobenzoate synthetase component 2
MILMIDNYDSFTYNLVHYLEEMSEEVVVKRNDAITIEEIEKLKPKVILLSPGPCTPNESGICLSVVDRFAGLIPILGICLGHQIIAQYYGAKVIKASTPVHGKVYPITHDGKGIYTNLKSPLNVTRYHSLVVEKHTLPDCLEVTSETEQGLIMGLRHKEFDIESVQFHPEAILTEYGKEMLANFIMNR